MTTWWQVTATVILVVIFSAGLFSTARVIFDAKSWRWAVAGVVVMALAGWVFAGLVISWHERDVADCATAGGQLVPQYKSALCVRPDGTIVLHWKQP